MIKNEPCNGIAKENSLNLLTTKKGAILAIATDQDNRIQVKIMTDVAYIAYKVHPKLVSISLIFLILEISSNILETYCRQKEVIRGTSAKKCQMKTV